MSVLQNIIALETARELVQAHPMCGALKDEGSKVIIVYPAGDFPVDGLRVERSAAGLVAALQRMERHWTESFPGARP